MDIYLNSLLYIILFAILIYKINLKNEPLKFEPHEKFTKKNKWLVWYEFTLILGCLNALSKMPFSNSSIELFGLLIDLALFGTMFYLFMARKNFAFKLIFILVAIQTWSMVCSSTISINDESAMSLYIGLYTLIWLLPNYIYFSKRRTLFEQLNSNKVVDEIIDRTVEDMKKDLAIALQQGDLELAQAISERISSANSLNPSQLNNKQNNNKFKYVISKICIGLAIFLGTILSIITFFFYVYTLYIYFIDYGFWQGFISMLLPILSTIWLCIQKWIEEGIDNLITTFGLIYLLIFAVFLIFYGLGVYLKDKLNEEN